jgi:hypothetical protein
LSPLPSAARFPIHSRQCWTISGRYICAQGILLG